MGQQWKAKHLPVKRLTMARITVTFLVCLCITACSDNTDQLSSSMQQEGWSNEDELLFQQEAALRHSLEQLKQQEKMEQDFQDNPDKSPE